MTAYEELRMRHAADLAGALPEFVARLDAPRNQIDLHRRRALRLLLRVAKNYSPWWRERLCDVDPAEATEADLERIEPLTRKDLMEHWDEIVIYPNVRLSMVREHLESLEQDAYLLDSYHAVQSSGTSGRPGVFLYDWDGWLASYAGCARWRLRNRDRSLGRRGAPRIALVGASRASHISYAINQGFARGEFHAFPAHLGLDEILHGLEQVQPDALVGYPSVIHEIAGAAREGRLRIRPGHVNCGGEPLRPEVRDEIAAAWQARVSEGWGASEALPLASSCPSSGVLHANDDMVILEPVDSDGRRVPAGEASSRVYVTNLFNLALPLIRYELDDGVRFSPERCACGSSFSCIEEVRSPREARFEYAPGVTVDTGMLCGVLAREKAVRDFQIRQTERGAEVSVCCERTLHLRAVGQRVASALCKGGVVHPSVSVRRVDAIERGPTGKLQRLVPRV